MFAQDAPTLFQSIAPVRSWRTSPALPVAAVVIALAGVGFMAREWASGDAAKIDAAKIDAAPPALGLALSEQSNLVSVRWDRQSRIIATADRDAFHTKWNVPAQR